MKSVFLVASALVFSVLISGCTVVSAPTTVDLYAITGVPAPQPGAKAESIIIESVQYTGTVQWEPAHSIFAAETAYTAIIQLSVNPGWTWHGVPANSFSLVGAVCTNNEDSGLVRALFPPMDGQNYHSTTIGTLRYVHSGSFQRDAGSVNISTVKAFRMSQNEITRSQFNSVIRTDPSNATYSTGTNDPVQEVNWYQAIAFCNKLSLAEGLESAYIVPNVDFATLTFADIPTISNNDWNAVVCNWDKNGYRLPTEMEWMWAAIGGIKDRSLPVIIADVNSSGYLKGYSASSEPHGAQTYIADYVWYSGNCPTLTSRPAGSRLPNELGLFDMSGNVQEWCWDRYDAYPAGGLVSDSDTGRGAAASSNRTVRGGSWYNNASASTVAKRSYASPDGSRYDIGFRVVRP